MANALFVLIVFLLQLNKDKLHIVWPLGVKTNITYIEETSEVYKSSYLRCSTLTTNLPQLCSQCLLSYPEPLEGS